MMINIINVKLTPFNIFKSINYYIFKCLKKFYIKIYDKIVILQ